MSSLAATLPNRTAVPRRGGLPTRVRLGAPPPSFGRGYSDTSAWRSFHRTAATRRVAEVGAVSVEQSQADTAYVSCQPAWDLDVPNKARLEAGVDHLPQVCPPIDGATEFRAARRYGRDFIKSPTRAAQVNLRSLVGLNGDDMGPCTQGVQFSKARVHGEVSATTDEYNREMCARMGSDICYFHEWGMNYSHILPNLIVGSVPQDAEDVEYLRNHLGVTAILNLQEEKDWRKFEIDFGAIQDRCNRLGNIRLVRCPIVDFDTASLRASLPGTVTRLHSLLETGNTVYIHCTAGLGRAPGVAITYLHWLFDLSLEDAYSYFTERRKCNPRAAAIRGATMDAQLGSGFVSFCWDSSHLGKASHVEVTGSFNDWAAPGLELRKYADGFFMKEFCVPPGLWQYKFIADGRWCTDENHPSCNLDGNVNNVVLVRPAGAGSAEALSSLSSMD